MAAKNARLTQRRRIATTNFPSECLCALCDFVVKSAFRPGLRIAFESAAAPLFGFQAALVDAGTNEGDEILFAAALGASSNFLLCQRVAEDDADGLGPHDPRIAGQGFTRARDADRYNGNVAASHQQDETGLHLPEGAVDAACPLWKDTDEKPVLHAAHRFLNACRAGCLAADGKGIRVTKKPSHDGHAKERVARHVADRPR